MGIDNRTESVVWVFLPPLILIGMARSVHRGLLVCATPAWPSARLDKRRSVYGAGKGRTGTRARETETERDERRTRDGENETDRRKEKWRKGNRERQTSERRRERTETSEKRRNERGGKETRAGDSYVPVVYVDMY